MSNSFKTVHSEPVLLLNSNNNNLNNINHHNQFHNIHFNNQQPQQNQLSSVNGFSQIEELLLNLNYYDYDKKKRQMALLGLTNGNNVNVNGMTANSMNNIMNSSNNNGTNGIVNSSTSGNLASVNHFNNHGNNNHGNKVNLNLNSFDPLVYSSSSGAAAAAANHQQYGQQQPTNNMVKRNQSFHQYTNPNSVNYFYKNHLNSFSNQVMPKPASPSVPVGHHSNSPSPAQFLYSNSNYFSRPGSSLSQPQQQSIQSNKQIDHSASTFFANQNRFNSLNPGAYNIRFAVNGVSKFMKGTAMPPINKSIQAGDFGDDSGMIAENSRCIVIGLADGAGGNRNIGIDPQVFSRSLLGYCVEIIKSEDIMPTQMAKLACKSIHILESKQIDGSGTLCLLALDKKTNRIHALNIGDSGFKVVRNGNVVEKSRSTMAGSSPKQLYVSDSSSYKGISFITEEDIIQDSDQQEFAVRKGDFIILSSDGLYDVVDDYTIEKICKKHDENDLQGIADELVSHAIKSYVHTQRDDILVMVCKVEAKN